MLNLRLAGEAFASLTEGGGPRSGGRSWWVTQADPDATHRPADLPAFSLRLGHAAGLTSHHDVIQYRVAASLLEEGAKSLPHRGRWHAKRDGRSRLASTCQGRWVLTQAKAGGVVARCARNEIFCYCKI